MKGRSLLVALLGGPVAWTLHLFAVYLIVALWCSQGWGGRNAGVALATIAAVVVTGFSAWLGWKLWHEGKREAQRDAEPGTHETWDARLGERGARGIFLAVLAMFLSALFAFLIIAQGVSPLIAPECAAGTGR